MRLNHPRIQLKSKPEGRRLGQPNYQQQLLMHLLREEAPR